MSSVAAARATTTTATAASDGIGAAGSTTIRTALIMTAPMPTIALSIWMGRRAADGPWGERLMGSEHRWASGRPERAFSLLRRGR